MSASASWAWKERRVLVTGATGFVGAWLVQALVEWGAAVVALVRDPHRPSELRRGGYDARIRVVQGAVEDFPMLAATINQERIETVFHLASTNRNIGADFSPLPTFDTNIRGTYHLLEACRRHGDRVSSMVVTSSHEACGKMPSTPADGAAAPGPHPYEASKRCVELLCQSYAATYGLRVSALRCPNIYGGGDLNWQRIIPGTIRSVLQGERPVIRSDGSLTRSYVYVADLVRALLLLARAGQGGLTYRVAEVDPVSVLELVRAIIRLSQREGLEPLIRHASAHDLATQAAAAPETVNRLGWKPAYSLEEGLRATLAWYRECLHREPAEASRSR